LTLDLALDDERGIQPSEFGVRITYLATPPRTKESVPDCDFVVPFGDPERAKSAGDPVGLREGRGIGDATFI
jgi:hypothetical protein